MTFYYHRSRLEIILVQERDDGGSPLASTSESLAMRVISGDELRTRYVRASDQRRAERQFNSRRRIAAKMYA